MPELPEPGDPDDLEPEIVQKLQAFLRGIFGEDSDFQQAANFQFHQFQLPPEVPQRPDIAYEAKCKNCGHILESHTVTDMEFRDSPLGGDNVRFGWRFNCEADPLCPCHNFQPEDRYVAGFRKGPGI
jgi:hypothetical protein